MPSERPLRSPLLMSRGDTALLVVDLQDKLMPAIDGREGVIERCRLLIQAARILGVPTLVTEQYPKGLGKTVAEIADGGNQKVLLAAGRLKDFRACCAMVRKMPRKGIAIDAKAAQMLEVSVGDRVLAVAR